MSRRQAEPTDRVLRSAKRRRTEDGFAGAGAGSTSEDKVSLSCTTVGFHRTLQERWLALLFIELEAKSRLEVELAGLLLERDKACTSRDRQDDVVTVEYEACQAILGRAAEFRRTFRQVTSKAIQSTNDMVNLAGRYSSIILQTGFGDADTVTEVDVTPLPTQYLSASAAELLVGSLCEGLFESLTLDAARDPIADWTPLLASLVESASLAGSTRDFAEHRAVLLEDFKMLERWGLGITAELDHFCAEVNTIVYTAAQDEVQSRVDIIRQMGAHRLLFPPAQARSVEAAMELFRIEDEVDEMEKRIRKVDQALHLVLDAEQEQILQLVVLSK